MMAMMSDAIHDYIERGWSVIPIRRGDKRPLVRWEHFQHTRVENTMALGWFRTWPDAGIGVVTGAISGIVVVDLDVRHGGDVSFESLERKHGSVPRTVECRTGGGGRHLYFAHPGGLIRNRVALAPGVDLRGDGGYVVAPPSLHSSGVRYEWIDGCSPGRALLSPLPEWVFREAVDEFPRRRHPIAYWRRLVSNGALAGERNNTIASLVGHLLRYGVDPGVATELLLCWNRVRCRPPLPDDEVVAVVASITRLHAREAEARSAPGLGEQASARCTRTVH